MARQKDNKSKEKYDMGLFNKIRSRLSLGESLTYKDLCKKLDLQYVSGNQKKYQLKDLQRYLDFENVNRKLIITNIYDEVLAKETRVASNAIYVKYIECILLSCLAKQPGYKVYKTNNELYYILGMVTDKFEEYAKSCNYNLLVDDVIKYTDVVEFFERCRSNFYDILTSSLKSLENRLLIQHEKIYMICKWDNGNYIKHEATDDETSKILEIKRKVMLNFGAEIEFQIYINNKTDQYYKDLDKQFKEEFGWDKVYKTNKIIYSQKNIIEVLPDDVLKWQQLMLNNEVVNKNRKQVEKIYQKEKEELQLINVLFKDIDFINEDTGEKDCIDNYIKLDEPTRSYNVQNYLIDRFIKID